MPIVTTKEMFEKAQKGGYAIGAFNVNNMEIIQGIVDAAQEENSPVIPYTTESKPKSIGRSNNIIIYSQQTVFAV